MHVVALLLAVYAFPPAAAIDVGVVTTLPLLWHNALQSVLHGGDFVSALPHHGLLDIPHLFATAMRQVQLQAQLLQALDPVDLSLPPSTTTGVPSNTGLTLPSDAGTLWGSLSAEFESFLDRNPDLKLSASDYAAKTIKAPAEGVVGNIGAKFSSFLDANPEWKGSASAFVDDFWKSEVLDKYESSKVVFADSPLARGTREFLTQLSSIGNADVFASLKGSSLSMPSMTANEAANKLVQQVGSKTLEEFNSIIDDNPKLKLTTSAFVEDYYKTQFQPQLQYFLGVVSQSPLARGTQAFASTSTSEFTSNVAAATADKLSPVFEPLTKPLLTPIVDFFQSSREAVIQSVKDSTSAVSSIASSALTEGGKSGAAALQQFPTSASFTAPDIHLPEVQLLPTFEGGVFVSTVQQLGQKASVATTQVGKLLIEDSVPALGRAATSFGEQLGTAGSTLVSRTGSFVDAVSSSIGRIATDAVTVLPSRTADVLAGGSSTALEASTAAVETVSSKVSDLAANSELLLLKGNELLVSAKSWKLFPDDSHWETGFWEQQYRSLNRLAKEVADPVQRQQLIETSKETLNAAGDRFVAAYQNARSGYKQFDAGVATAAEKLAVATEQFAKGTSQATAFAKTTINSLSDSLSSLARDTRSYVNDFINTNTDL